MKWVHLAIVLLVIIGCIVLVQRLLVRRQKISFWLKWNLIFFMAANIAGAGISTYMDFNEMTPNGKFLLNNARLVVSGMILALVVSLLLSREIAHLRDGKGTEKANK